VIFENIFDISQGNKVHTVPWPCCPNRNVLS